MFLVPGIKKRTEYRNMEYPDHAHDRKLETVEKEMVDHGFGCLGLSETRWTGKGHFVTDLGSTVIYSGLEEKKASGVAVMLDRITAKSPMGYNPISDRILTVRLAAEPWNVTLIQVYAPTKYRSQNRTSSTPVCSKSFRTHPIKR